MKKVVLALVALFVFTVNGNSQVPQVRQNRQFSKEEMVQRRTDRLAQDLGLNENQKASLLKLNTDFADKLGNTMRPRMGRGEAQKGLENTVKPNEQEVQKMRDEIKTNREKYNAELKKILTSEQYAKYEQQQKDRMKQFGDRQRGNRGGHDDMTKPQE